MILWVLWNGLSQVGLCAETEVLIDLVVVSHGIMAGEFLPIFENTEPEGCDDQNSTEQTHTDIKYDCIVGSFYVTAEEGDTRTQPAVIGWMADFAGDVVPLFPIWRVQDEGAIELETVIG